MIMTEEIKGMDGLVTASKQISIAIGLLNQTITKVFPQGTAVTASSGGSSGKFLTIIATDGNAYKIPLDNP